MPAPKKRSRHKEILITSEQGVRVISSLRPGFRDFYYYLLGTSWAVFFLTILGLFLSTNLFFAVLYRLTEGIGGMASGDFVEYFFFSVHTISTIGYGSMYPKSLVANILVVTQAIFAMFFFATLTGLIFSKFARPSARVLFSRVAVIHPDDGVPSLVFRLANERSTHIASAELRVYLLRDEVTREGAAFRRFHDIKLVRHRTPSLSLSWTVMHRIDETSPLYGVGPAEFGERNMLLMVSLSGYDPILAQNVMASHNYLPQNIRWQQRFVDSLTRLPQGSIRLDYDRLHETEDVV